MTLSQLAIGLGIFWSVPAIYALAQPGSFTIAAKKFPRSENWGYLFMALGTLWFLYNLNAESISDFADYKKMMLIGFGAVGVLTCIFVKDFLAVRGLAILLLLLAKLMLDTARWHDSQWRILVSLWAYVMILAGMTLTISPWRYRDLVQWAVATPERLKRLSMVRLAFCVLLIALGATAFR